MEENRNNRLDNLFKSRLKNLENESWNTPNNDVFEGAMAKIAAERKRKRRFFLIWSGGLGLLAFLLFLTYWNYSTLNDINAKMATLDEQFEASEQIEIEEADGAQQISNEIVERDATLETDIAQTNPVQKQVFNVIRKAKFDNQIPFSNLVPSDKSEEISTLVDSDIQDEVNEGIQISSFVVPYNNDLSSIGLTGFGPYSKKYPGLAIALRTNDKIHSNKHSIRFHVGPITTSVRMNADPGIVSNLKEYDKWYLGFQSGFQYDYQLAKKWNAFSSLNYKQVNNVSTTSLDHIYAKSNEYVNQDGDLEYSTSVNIESPMGLHAENAIVPMGTLNVPDNEVMNQKTNVSSTFKIVSLQFGVGYQIYSASRFDVALSPAVTINKMVAMSEDMNYQLYLGQDMLTEVEYKHSGLESLKNTYTSAQIGISSKYNLSSKWFLGVDLVGEKSLQSILLNDQVSVKFAEFGTLLSVGMKF